ncbi:MAG: T9SS type A sorting domain-containing protein [bacterium]|nr:T9SS type A sorting domain-containing protein [bacterium]
MTSRTAIYYVLLLAALEVQAQSWQVQHSTSAPMYDIVCPVGSHVWAVGRLAGTVWHSDNLGQDWESQTTGIGNFADLYGVDFVDDQHGWAVGSYRTIIYTASGGNAWDTLSLETGSSTAYRAVDFINTTTGWVVGDDGAILYTQNGGLDWQPQVSGTTQILDRVEFVDSQNGWILMRNSSLLYTTNGGATWTPQDVDAFDVADISFVDAQNGWACTARIRNTTNGGIDWNPQYTAPSALTAIHMLNATVGWAVGSGTSNGTIARTANGGTNWTLQTLDSNFAFSSVTAISEQHAWAVGASLVTGFGVIIHFDATILAASEPTEIPTGFTLQPNFPNPFNPQTTIAFDVPRAGHVTLRVTDINGREVAILEDGTFTAGQHEVTFDGVNLASGIYFATLSAANFSQTQKMILLK